MQYARPSTLAGVVSAMMTGGLLFPLNALSGTNPIITNVYTADPAAMVAGNTVYLYTGHDENQASFYTMNDWRCYSSQDMTNWTSYGSILSYTNFAWATGSAWASQCVQKNGKYYWFVTLFGTNNYQGASYYGNNVGVAVSDSPSGPFQDARGTPLIKDGMTTGGDIWDDIDPTVFTDTNGVSWLGWGHGTFYLAQLDDSMTNLASPIQAYHLPYYTEGPWLHRHGNLYYLSYASTPPGGSEQIRYATAPSVTGPWTPRGLVAGNADNSYTIQDSIIDFNGQAYFFYHNGDLSGGGSFDRSVCLDYLYYNPDGTIQPVAQTVSGVTATPRNDNLAVGGASGWAPANGATAVPWCPYLSWQSGSNAVAHAVYLGSSSNAVAEATFTSPEYQATTATNNFSSAALAPQTTYFWRVDEIRGTNTSPGAVQSFTTGALMAHRYSFLETGGTNITDSVGGAAWTGTLPNGGTLSGGQLTFSAGSQQCARLPAGIVQSLGGITIMAWVNLSSNANWCRIFDFGNNSTAYIYLTPQNGSGLPQFGITSTGAGGERTVAGGSALSTNAWHQVAVTLSGETGIPGVSGAGGLGLLYVDGVLVGSNSGFALNPSSLGATTNNYLGRSQYGSDPYLKGSIGELRIYNGALAPADIAAAYLSGSEQASASLAYPWLTQDIGSVGVAGSAQIAAGVFTMAGSGADIWGAADAFRYTYAPVNGDCTLVARVASQQGVDSWSKAGLMIRENLNTNAANVFVGLTPSNGVTWQYRLNATNNAGATTFNNSGGLIAPFWVMLTRKGNVIAGYRSPDGTNWTQQGVVTNIMLSTLYAGLAVSSHNNSNLCQATFDNVAAPNWQAVAAPGTPTALVATAVSSLQVALAWGASSDATSYNIRRSTTNGGPYTTIATGVSAASYCDSGLGAGTAYYYVVSALNAGGESAASAQAAATTPPLSLGSLIHRYSFNETSGTNVADSVGGPAWNGTLPNGGAFSGGRLTLSSNAQQYVSLPAGILSNLSGVTIEAWAAFPANLPWAAWFFGFGDMSGTAGANYLLCAPGGGRFAVSASNPGYLGETNANSGIDWSGKALHLSCVFNPSAGCLAIYTNGVLAGTNSSGTCTMSSIVDHYSFINRSLYSSDPYVSLTLDEFRIYARGLSAADIAATEALGPDLVPSAGVPVVKPALSGTNLTLSWPLASPGFTLQSCSNLALGDWVALASPKPQIVGDRWEVDVPARGGETSMFYRIAK